MNLSSGWPTTVWLQLLLCPYHLIVDCCNHSVAMGQKIAHVLKHHNYCGNHSHCDCQVALAFKCIQRHNNVIIALGVTLRICSCVTRTMQISSCTRLVLEILSTFRHQLCMERDVTAAFLPHQGQPLARGLTIVMTLVTNVAFILRHFGHSQDWWQSMSTGFVT